MTELGALPPISASAPAEADGDLLERAQSGDRSALDELVRRHRNAAFVLALQMTRNPDDALDVSQEAMLRLVGHIGTLDRDRALRPWLFTVVRNLVRDLWRKRKLRRTEPLAVEVGPDLGHQIVDRAGSPEDDAVSKQVRHRLWSALSALPDKHREILVLRDYHDLSYEELARVLTIPMGTVMSRLHAARKKLRAAYLGLGSAVTSERRRDGENSHD
ncbi:MAG: RNA polymerase sigma factor [Thermoanaerobaculia bacterium]